MLKRTVTMLSVMAASAGSGAAAGVLDPADFRHYVDAFNVRDNELYTQAVPNRDAWEFLRHTVPLLDCPDEDLKEIFLFRWWTFRKHLKATPDGFVITEFLPAVPWAGKYNTINCPAGHHFREARWLADRRYLDDYARFWLRHGGALRSYSFWIADSLLAFHRARPNRELLVDLLPDLTRNWDAWAASHQQPDGLFYQVDDRDGMEIGIGGSGKRPTINSYMYGDAVAIAAMARLVGDEALAADYEGRAARLRDLVLAKLWDPDARFFETLASENQAPHGRRGAKPKAPVGQRVGVRELIGFVPWYFHLPPPGHGYEAAWTQLMDPKGFYAPYGPTTAEQRHPGFKISYHGHACQWNGPSWPFATTQTLVALGNVLHDYPQRVVTKADYWQTLQCYLRSHRLRELPPAEWGHELTRSHDDSVARHTWFDHDRLGGTEWVQYDFPEPVLLDAAEVFWYDDDAGIDPPASWRLLVPDGDAWQPVAAQNGYGTRIDQYNRVEFSAVRTSRLRLEAVAAPGKCAGILEWRVFGNGKNLAPTGKPSASYTDRWHGKIEALNDGDRRPKQVASDQPWIDENLNPFNGDWIARTMLKRNGARPGLEERGKDYNHSGFCDLVITGLVGLRPRPDEVLEVEPLVPDGWDWFCLDRVPYHGVMVTVLWDRTGEHYGRGKGFLLLADGQVIGRADVLQRMRVELNAGRRPAPAPRGRN